MSENYEEIARQWFWKMRASFIRVLMARYAGSRMRTEDAENIYADVFIAIHDNLEAGRIAENTDWNAYIMRVGMWMASKKYRKTGVTSSLDEVEADVAERYMARAGQISELFGKRHGDDDGGIATDPDAKALVGDELARTLEPCKSIISKTYVSGMSDAEIAEETPPYCDNGKPVEVNARAVRARRWLCMNDLKYRVRLALYNAGIINVKPEKPSRNGKRN